jgi:hypothetical protein
MFIKKMAIVYGGTLFFAPNNPATIVDLLPRFIYNNFDIFF